MGLPVAILIVNYRVYEDLARVLASVTPALRPGDEIVVFDQESDASALARVLAPHPSVRAVVDARNVGFAAGINRAARVSRAPFLLWLNPDTVLEGPVVDTLERWLVDHPDIAVAGPRVMNDDGTVQPSARRFPGWSTAFGGRTTWLTRRFPDNALSRYNLGANTAAAPVTVDWIAGSCLMTRRTVFEALGGLDEAFFLYWEDADFCRRAAEAGLGTSTYVPQVAVRHAGGRSASLVQAASIRAFHRSAAMLYRKHARSWRRLAAPVVALGLRVRGELLALRRVRSTKHEGRSTGDD
jgi:GT2 family glycosyltransferase